MGMPLRLPREWWSTDWCADRVIDADREKPQDKQTDPKPPEPKSSNTSKEDVEPE